MLTSPKKLGVSCDWLLRTLSNGLVYFTYWTLIEINKNLTPMGKSEL